MPIGASTWPSDRSGSVLLTMSTSVRLPGSRSFTLTSTASETYSLQTSGNTITGQSSSSQSGSNTYHLQNADTYSDGSDTQTVDRTGSSMLTSQSGNSLTGVYSSSTSGSMLTTLSETGNRGTAYSNSSSDTNVYSSQKAGNSITGDYNSQDSSSDNGSQTWATTGGGAFSTTTANQSQDDSTQTGNSVTGDYTGTATKHETLTTDQTTSPAAGGDFTLHETETVDSSTTDGGNSLSGDYSATTQETVGTTFNQSGSDAAGTFSVTETTSDSPTLTTTGNSISAQYSILQTGAVVYTIHQTNTAGDTNFTLDGGGTQSYSRTDTFNANTGDRSSTETGSDAYSLTDIGTDSVGSYTQSLSGTDPYTTIVTSNDLNGGYTRTTSGSGDYSLTESDGGGDPVTTGGSHQFSTTSSGNYIDGQVSLNATGVDHYHLLRGFNDTSNGGTCTAGTVDYSPVGAAFFLGTGVMGPTGGAARAAATDAVFGDPGSLPYQHCFVAGTPVLTGGGKTRPIDQILPGETVLAVSDSDPQAKPQLRRVERVFANGPQPIFAVVVEGHRIGTTAGHPFYVCGRGFVQVKDLRPGDELLSQDGRRVPVEEVVDTGRVERVYNFQVADHHTYYVGGADWGFDVLVHNDSSGQTAPTVQASDGVCRLSAWNRICRWFSDVFTNDYKDSNNYGTRAAATDGTFTAIVRENVADVAKPLYRAGVNLAKSACTATSPVPFAVPFVGKYVSDAVFGSQPVPAEGDYSAFSVLTGQVPEAYARRAVLQNVAQLGVCAGGAKAMEMLLPSSGASGAAFATKPLEVPEWVGELGAGANSAPAETGRLVHLTNADAGASINSSGTLIGNTYAGPLSNAEASGLGVTCRTGLSPSAYEVAVPIPSSAQGAFSAVRPIGPVTGWQWATGQQYTARGVLDLGTGAFVRQGVNWNQAMLYSIDVGLDAMGGTTLYYLGKWLYGSGNEKK